MQDRFYLWPEYWPGWLAKECPRVYHCLWSKSRSCLQSLITEANITISFSHRFRLLAWLPGREPLLRPLRVLSKSAAFILDAPNCLTSHSLN
eukprot:SAG31_NODE_4845_length_2908_cov_5.326095_2_plen_92_part_00